MENPNDGERISELALQLARQGRLVFPVAHSVTYGKSESV